MENKQTSPVVVAVTTFPSEREAVSFAHRLVERKLAACCQVEPGLISIYYWDCKIHETPECRLWIKTTASAAAEIEASLPSTHPYEVPQWIIYRPEHIQPKFEDWLRQSV